MPIIHPRSPRLSDYERSTNRFYLGMGRDKDLIKSYLLNTVIGLDLRWFRYMSHDTVNQTEVENAFISCPERWIAGFHFQKVRSQHGEQGYWEVKTYAFPLDSVSAFIQHERYFDIQFKS